MHYIRYMVYLHAYMHAGLHDTATFRGLKKSFEIPLATHKCTTEVCSFQEMSANSTNKDLPEECEERLKLIPCLTASMLTESVLISGGAESTRGSRGIE